MGGETWLDVLTFGGYGALQEQRRARQAQENLEEQRKRELRDEAAAREAAERKSQERARTAGRSRIKDFFSTGFGFGAGSGMTQPTETRAPIRRGNLFGN